MTNCPNCGAPLKGPTCDYCGTKSGKSREKELVYMYRGKEIENPTEEMMCDPYLLVTWIDKTEGAGK
jgi:hypothetical protein